MNEVIVLVAHIAIDIIFQTGRQEMDLTPACCLYIFVSLMSFFASIFILAFMVKMSYSEWSNLSEEQNR